MHLSQKITAVCTAKIHEDHIRRFIEAFSRSMTENGRLVYIYSACTDMFYDTPSDMGEAAVFDLINYDETESVVIIKSSIKNQKIIDRITEKCRKTNTPLIIADGSEGGSTSVNFDYDSGFEAVVRHLTDVHGVNDIYMLAGVKGIDVSENRIEILKRIAAEKNIPFGDDRISYCDFWSQPAVKACNKLIESGNIPHTVICANDIMAIAAEKTFKQHGYRVPEDVIITGFDGIGEIMYSVPKITSAMCDFGKLGEAAAQAAINAAEGAHSKDILVPSEMIVSESCGCISKSAVDAADIITETDDLLNRYLNEERKLNLISSKVQMCDTVDEAEEELRNRVFYDMTCILKKECADSSCDPMKRNTDTPFGEDMIILMDTRTNYVGRDRNIKLSETIPDIDEVHAGKAPLIFTSLHLIDIPFGYICFYFNTFSKADYMKVTQSSSAVNNALCGFRNRRYQSYLQKKIEDMYKFDIMTGLYTRSGFGREFDRIVSGGEYECLTLILCDLDGLKYINDNFSHTEGDNAIIKTAEALKYACPGGIGSKYGGDEILALMTVPCDPQKIKADINEYLERYNKVSGKPYTVSASVGIYTSDGGEDFAKMFSETDKLMYKEKSVKKQARK